MRAVPPTESVRGGCFPRVPFVDFFVFARCGHGIAEILAKCLIVQRLVFSPKQVANLMHGEPVAKERVRIIANGEPERLIFNAGSTDKLVGKGQFEIRQPYAAGLEIAGGIMDCDE